METKNIGNESVNSSGSINRKSFSDQAYDLLKEMISNFRFSPGANINVEKLTHEFGISRTPIWEAVRRLEQEGILKSIPYKGVKVREFSLKEALDLYEVREALECLASRLGASRVTSDILEKMNLCLIRQRLIAEEYDEVAYSKSDAEFHSLVYEASGNELLKNSLQLLRFKALPLNFEIKKILKDFIEFHFEILEAFRNGDTKNAEAGMRRHNQKMIEIIKKKLG